MAYRELLEYVDKARGKGAADNDITARLTSAGWYAVDVQDALSLHGKLNKPEVAALASHSARTQRYDPSIVKLATLSFIIGFIGYLLLSK